MAQYIQCGGTNTTVTSSIVNITGGAVAKAAYVNGYGTASKPAPMSTSQFVISGGEITALYDARNMYSPVSGAVAVVFSGNSAAHIGEINLQSKKMISGKRQLVFSNVQNPVLRSDLSAWDDFDTYDGGKNIANYNDEHGTAYLPAAGFGAPMWLVNTKENAVYMLSAKYRTTYGSVGDTANYLGYESVNDNYYIITKFNLPSLSAGEQVVLTPTDIIDQFTTDFAAFATQGGTVFDDKIIYMF